MFCWDWVKRLSWHSPGDASGNVVEHRSIDEQRLGNSCTTSLTLDIDESQCSSSDYNDPMTPEAVNARLDN